MRTGGDGQRDAAGTEEGQHLAAGDANDSIFNQSGGATLLAVTQDGDTYKTTFSIAVQLA